MKYKCIIIAILKETAAGFLVFSELDLASKNSRLVKGMQEFMIRNIVITIKPSNPLTAYSKVTFLEALKRV